MHRNLSSSFAAFGDTVIQQRIKESIDLCELLQTKMIMFMQIGILSKMSINQSNQYLLMDSLDMRRTLMQNVKDGL